MYISGITNVISSGRSVAAYTTYEGLAATVSRNGMTESDKRGRSKFGTK
jgi:hypothetical protein